MTVMTSMVDIISIEAMDTPIAIILVLLFGGTVSFFILSVVMKPVTVLVEAIDSVNCAQEMH